MSERPPPEDPVVRERVEAFYEDEIGLSRWEDLLGRSALRAGEAPRRSWP